MVAVAIILAGGKGERLRPLTNDRPKTMVEVAGKPMTLWQIEWLKKFGVKKFILTLSYKAEVVQEYFGDGSKFGIEIDYSVEETPLGRGGAIKQAFKSRLAEKEDNLLVLNGDIMFPELDVEDLAEFHESKNGLVTDLLAPFISPWGIVDVDDEDHILGFKEKPKLPYWINGGIYIFNKEIVNLLPDVGDHEYETFPKIEKERFLGYKYEGFWKAVDMIKDKTEAEHFLTTGQIKAG